MSLEYLHPNIHRCVQKIVKERDIKCYKVYQNKVSTGGANYVATLYEVDIIFEEETDKIDQEINLFVKIAPPTKNYEGLISVSDMYSKEIFIYTELSQIYNKLQDEANIPKNERFNMIKTFGGCDSQTIAMENVIKKGFIAFHACEPASLKLISKAIQEIAKFHALSFALQNYMPEYFEEKIKIQKPTIYFGKTFRKFLTTIRDAITSDCSKEVAFEIEKFAPRMYEKMPKYYNGETSSVRCLCHGDFKLCNILMKKTDSENREVLLCDYQILHYGSPMTDIMCFIYSASDSQFRSVHMPFIKNIYFDTFTNFLSNFSIDGNVIYPRKIFDKDFEDSREFGLMFSLYLLPLNYVVQDGAIDFEKEIVCNAPIKLNDNWKDRLKGFIDELTVVNKL